MPKVSVIIPVYNVENYLRQCIDSVVNQTLQDIEIICINDGSTDNSLSILQEYANKDSRIIVITKEHEGTGQTRNRGLNVATGEFIGFIDPDDWIEPDFYSTLYNTAISKNVDVVQCHYRKFYEESNSFKNIKSKYKNGKLYKFEDIKSDCFRLLTNYCVLRIVKKSLIDEYNMGFSDAPCGQDKPFSLSCKINSNGIYYINDVLYNYRIRANSSSFVSLVDALKIINSLKTVLINANKLEDTRESLNDYITYLCKKEFLRANFKNKIATLSKFKKGLEKDEYMYFKKKFLYQYYLNLILPIENEKMKNIIQNIFSVKNVKRKNGTKHKVLIILGIKLKFRKK